MKVFCRQTKVIFPFSLLYPIHSDNLNSPQGEVLGGSKNETGIRDLGAGICRNAFALRRRLETGDRSAEEYGSRGAGGMK